MHPVEEATRAGGKLAMQHFGTVEDAGKEAFHDHDALQQEKMAFSFVDHHVQDTIVEMLKEHYPDAVIVAEEGDDESTEIPTSGTVILIDPIDGTRNYLSATPGHPRHRAGFEKCWGVSVCIMEGHTPVSGAIYIPCHDLMIFTEKGKGTFVNGTKMQVSDDCFTKEKTARLSQLAKVRHPHLLEKLIHYHSGSFVYDVLALLHGTCPTFPKSDEVPVVHAHFCCEINILDVGCGTLAYEEAGGYVLDEDGKPCNPMSLWKHIPKKGIILHNPFFMTPTKECWKQITH